MHMNPLYISVVSIALAALALSERFYARFYPEPATQKRHLKAGFGWLLIIGSVVYQIWGIVHAAKEPFPTTAPHLVALIGHVALSTCLVFLIATVSLMDYLISRLVVIHEGTLRIVGKLIDLSAK